MGGSINSEVPCRKILRHVKDPLKSHGEGQTKFSFPSHILLLSPEMSLLIGPPDSTGSCQSALVDKFGVRPSRYHHIMLNIANHPEMNSRPVEAAVLRRQSHPIITNLPLCCCGFYYTLESKREKLFVERGKFDYTRSAKRAVAAYEICHCCLKT
jgi:hypothetical protein